jgi:hypothetical protein
VTADQVGRQAEQKKNAKDQQDGNIAHRLILAACRLSLATISQIRQAADLKHAVVFCHNVAA